MGRSKIRHDLIIFSYMVLWIANPLNSIAQGLLLDEDLETKSAYSDQKGNKSLEHKTKGVYKIDLKPYAPRPQHQGEILSCTGWAVGYGALSILHAVKNNWKDSIEKIKNNAFSALFIYNQIWKGNCVYSGSNIMDAGKLLIEKGDIAAKEFDKFKNRCDKLPKVEELKQAEKFKIQTFEKLFNKEESSLDKIYKTKASLSRKLPVVIGITIKKNFKLLKPGNTFWNPLIGDTTFADQHAMTVIGFDDDKGAFELMNSWGTEWANGGFVWIKYTDFAEYTKQAYHFIPFNYLLNENEIEVNISLEIPGHTEEGTLRFSAMNTLLENHLFSPVEKLNTGDQLRLEVQSSRSQLYVYCFSIDSKKNEFIHWPKYFTPEGKVNEFNKLKSISGINKLFIPDEYKAFVFNEQGSEFLYVLISPQKIPRFIENLSIFKKLQIANKYDGLKKAFGKNLISAEKMSMNEARVGVKALFSDKMILPVIIKVDIR